MIETTTIDRDIAPLLVEQLREGRTVRFRAEGRSMEPFLFAGDVVEVEPLRIDDDNRIPRPGEVLCYERASGILRLHRFVRWEKAANGVHCLRIRGDALGQGIEHIPPEAVLGVLVAFEHNGQRHSARCLLWRMKGLWWPRIRSRILRRHPTTQNSVDDIALRQITEALRTTLCGRVEHPATANRVIDTKALIATANRHGVLAICADELIRCWPEAEADIRTALRARVLESENSRSFIAEALTALATAGIKPMIVKGPALAALAYGNPAIRPYDDVDLLLEGDERKRAAEVLLQCGWQDSRNSPLLAIRHLLRTTEDLAFVNPHCRVSIEIVHPNGLLRDARPSASSIGEPFDIQQAPAQAPSKTEHFLFCAAHAAKHGWSRLVWVADLDRLSASFTDEDWNCVIAQAKARRLTRVLALSMTMAATLLDTPVPVEALRPFGKPIQSAKKIAAGRNAQRTAGHVDTWRWWAGLLDTPSQRVRHFTQWLFQPTGADLRVCLLPLWAHSLYHVLRPLRLVLRVVLRQDPPKLTWEPEEKS